MAKSKKIPATVRNKVWDKYIGIEQGQSTCVCCNSEPITKGNFHCGHVKADSKGGKKTVTNLRPICGLCNSSIGTQNMVDFMKEHGFETDRVIVKRGSAIEKVIPNKFADVFNLDKGTKMSRGQMSKAVFAYAAENGLKNPDNGRIILPNDTLIKLFNLEEGEVLNLGSVSKYLAQLCKEPNLSDEEYVRQYLENMNSQSRDLLIQCCLSSDSYWKFNKNMSVVRYIDSGRRYTNQLHHQEMYIRDICGFNKLEDYKHPKCNDTRLEIFIQEIFDKKLQIVKQLPLELQRKKFVNDVENATKMKHAIYSKCIETKLFDSLDTKFVSILRIDL